MDPSRLIAILNALTHGDLGSIQAKLQEAEQACGALGQPELAEKLRLAGEALRGGDVKTYRRSLETVVSRLGHLK